MKFYKYMPAHTFCNYFCEIPKLKMSKLSEFSDIYEPETLLTESELMSELEFKVLKFAIKQLDIPTQILSRMFLPKKMSIIFDEDTSNIRAKAFQTRLKQQGEDKYLNLKTTYFNLLAVSTSEIRKIIEKLSKNLIVLCISSYNGSQILYEKYGEHKGVMLEFDDKYMINMIKVEYGTNKRKKYFIKSLDRILEAIIKNDEKTLNSIFFKLFAFKNGDYKHEHEYRILIYSEDADKIPQISKHNEKYLLNIGLPTSITIGIKFDKNEGANMKIREIKEFCKKHKIKLYQAQKSKLDDEMMQREEIELE